MKREQRAAGWVRREISSEPLPGNARRSPAASARSPFVSQPAGTGGDIDLATAWRWGITGGTGYALATEIPYFRAASNLDLLIRAPQPSTAKRLLFVAVPRRPSPPCQAIRGQKRRREHSRVKRVAARWPRLLKTQSHEARATTAAPLEQEA